MPDSDQPELDLEAETPSYYTDEALCRELQQIENRLADWAQAIPNMVRRIHDLRESLRPSG